jgi:hypothetical protein
MQPPNPTQVVDTVEDIRRWVQTRPDVPVPQPAATDAALDPLWQGARILVCEVPLPRPPDGDDPWHRFDRHVHVCTPHAQALAELLDRLRDGMSGLLDAERKHLFFGALAQAALEHQARHPQGASERGLLLAVLEEAMEIGLNWSREPRQSE